MIFYEGLNIPDYASLNEYGAYLELACDEDYSKLVMNFGLTKLYEAENSYVHENIIDSAKDLGSKVISWIKEQAEKIRKAIEKAITKISDKVDEYKKKFLKWFGAKSKADVTKRVEYLDKDKTFKWYPFNGDSGDIQSRLSKFNNELFEDGADPTEMKLSIAGESFSFDDSASEIRDAIKKHMRGAEEAEDIKKDKIKNIISDAFDYVFSKENTVRKLKLAYKDIVRGLKQLLDKAKKKDKEYSSENVRAIKGFIKIENAIAGAVISVTQEHLSLATKLVIAVGRTKKPKKEKDSTNESYSYGEGSGYTFSHELNSLFDF